jgi:hypothetical protein
MVLDASKTNPSRKCKSIDRYVQNYPREMQTNSLILANPSVLNIWYQCLGTSITYGISVWGQACKTYLDKILILQKRVMRMMYFTDRYDNAIPLFLDLCILPVTFLYCETVSGLMYDINNNNAPLNILNLFD